MKENNIKAIFNFKKSNKKITMYFEGPQEFSSIKCQYPPGGQDNFQFSYNGPYQPPQSHFNKFPDTKVNYNILNLQSTKENNGMSQNVRNCSIRTDYNNGREKVNIFKNQYNDNYIQPSIRVTQMPGGNSRVAYAKNQ